MLLSRADHALAFSTLFDSPGDLSSTLAGSHTEAAYGNLGENSMSVLPTKSGTSMGDGETLCQ